MEFLKPVTSDILTWLKLVDDEWLKQAIRDTLARGSSLAHARAVGMAIRLCNYERQDAHDFAACATGKAPPPDRGPIRLLFECVCWIRQLDNAAVDDMANIAISTVERLEEELEALFDTIAPDDVDFRQRLVCLRAERDLLECVLRVIGGPGRINGLADGLDSKARRIMRVFPPIQLEETELTRRINELDPDSWWAWDMVNPPLFDEG